ncbi:trypsin [Dictyocaulus viviparus]|uniref:Trypsin n=1 Tax=Dictyocaulus viviparus TaxID=29172 RepID=A0A0D8Y5U6_DICVI|nr:trypsin [Dictyocaulus viviparus]
MNFVMISIELSETMALIIVISGLLLCASSITTTSSNDFYAVLHGNLSQSDRNELPKICGREFLTDTLQSRSAGGVLVRENEYPWVLLLTDPEWTRVCTAVLISRRHVLTAAHCVTNFPKDRKLEKDCHYTTIQSTYLYVYPRTRVNDALNIKRYTSSFSVARVMVHPSFSCSNATGDIALLELTLNIFTEASPICMPHFNESIPKNAAAAGFGKNPNISNNTRPMQVVNLTYQGTTGDRIMTKTTGRTICPGDSGGPLFKTNGTHYVLLGIASTYQKNSCTKTSKCTTRSFLYN